MYQFKSVLIINLSFTDDFCLINFDHFPIEDADCKRNGRFISRKRHLEMFVMER